MRLAGQSAQPTTNYNNNQKLSVRAQKGQPKCLLVEGGRHSGCSLATYGLDSRSEFILQSLKNSRKIFTNYLVGPRINSQELRVKVKSRNVNSAEL